MKGTYHIVVRRMHSHQCHFRPYTFVVLNNGLVVTRNTAKSERRFCRRNYTLGITDMATQRLKPLLPKKGILFLLQQHEVGCYIKFAKELEHEGNQFIIRYHGRADHEEQNRELVPVLALIGKARLPEISWGVAKLLPQIFDTVVEFNLSFSKPIPPGVLQRWI